MGEVDQKKNPLTHLFVKCEYVQHNAVNAAIAENVVNESSAAPASCHRLQ
jgi:hypothetical protein